MWHRVRGPTVLSLGTMRYNEARSEAARGIGYNSIEILENVFVYVRQADDKFCLHMEHRNPETSMAWCQEVEQGVRYHVFNRKHKGERVNREWCETGSAQSPPPRDGLPPVSLYHLKVSNVLNKPSNRNLVFK